MLVWEGWKIIFFERTVHYCIILLIFLLRALYLPRCDADATSDPFFPPPPLDLYFFRSVMLRMNSRSWSSGFLGSGRGVDCGELGITQRLAICLRGCLLLLLSSNTAAPPFVPLQLLLRFLKIGDNRPGNKCVKGFFSFFSFFSPSSFSKEILFLN